MNYLRVESTQHFVGHGGFHESLFHPRAGECFSFVFDCGGNVRPLGKAVKESGVVGRHGRRLDLLVISHLDRDHLSGVPMLVADGVIPSRVVLPFVDTFAVAAALAADRGTTTTAVDLRALEDAFAALAPDSVLEVRPPADGVEVPLEPTVPAEERPNESPDADSGPLTWDMLPPGTASGGAVLARGAHRAAAVWEIVAFVPPRVRSHEDDFWSLLQGDNPDLARELRAADEAPGFGERTRAILGALSDRSAIDALKRATRRAARLGGRASVNPTSLVVFSGPTTYRRPNGWLLTGDLTFGADAALVPQMRRAFGAARLRSVRVLNLAHHGANDGWDPRLLAELPRLSLAVGCACAQYGHPSRGPFRAVKAAGIAYAFPGDPQLLLRRRAWVRF